MKKLFLSLVAAIVAATATYAQTMLVATLSHGENVTMYYGNNALRNAHNAAVSGDVINLSGGAFQAVDITKAITLRGAGIDAASPSYITGNFTINIPADDANRLTFEGLRCSGTIYMNGTFNNPYFVKSQIYSIRFDGNAAIKSAFFGNCKITSTFYLSGTSTAQFMNCYVNGFHDYGYTNTSASFVNCVVLPYNSGDCPNYLERCQLLNCIVYQIITNRNSSIQLPSSTIATNCLSIGYSNLFGTQSANTGNKSVNYNEFTKVFKDFTGTYSESQTFELTDEAKTTYLGTDGTQVGLYGGVLPYSSTPSYPQITKMNVANKTTADGKLSVEIEVSAAQ